MTAAYSAFFSSGLLAPPNLYPKFGHSQSSPALPPTSPVIPPPLVDDSDTDDISMDTEEDARSVTPTPSCTSGRSRSGSTTSAIQAGQKPRLRRRRSSINANTSPMNVIKSPQRNAENALQLQRSIGRSRAGSFSFLGLGGVPHGPVPDSPNVASQTTSFISRMRSGSVGGASISSIFR